MTATPLTQLGRRGRRLPLIMGLILLGVVVNLLSAWKYRRYLKRLAEGVIPPPDPRMETLLAVLLALIGIGTAVYLMLLD